ncbi:putative membrane protein [Rhodococcus sp. SMB37]|uniref:YidH family protein n=1 Tax=Rhodococcus sp. SMB37 TaxID=2512213 RepID=UPI0006CFC001|nr:DUF202 domain-containing protein [Rhodococcus sp. SMB37]TCN52704.1 putative membrane protein [Rhodococcus sp. SMB37]
MPETPFTTEPVSVDEPDYRFTLANERTFLAWQRTSLGLLAAAVAVLHFLAETGHTHLAHALGGLLGAAALMSASGGWMRWRRVDQAIRRGLRLPASRLPLGLAVLLAGIGGTVIVAATISAAG